MTVWLVLDSGMHRLGLPPAAWQSALQRLQELGHVAEIVTMTHFARADELDSPRTREQGTSFEHVAGGSGLAASLGNSAAILGWPDVDGQWVRPGLMLYGASPFPLAHPLADQLRPVMTLEADVIAVRDIGVGEPVGYGGTFVAERPTRVGVVAAGYADGYPLFAPNGTPVIIDGQPGALIGRVSMDMLTVDLTDHPRAGLGSHVVLWGAGAPVTELATRVGSSAYALLCGLKRISRSYE